MGYDMELINPPAGTGGYFRLNIWGMGRYRAAMYDLGMVYEPTSDHPEFPDWARYDDKKRQDQFGEAVAHVEHGEALPDGVPADILDAARSYADQCRTVLRFHPEGGDTIPVHKFGSNDGWIVTPDEIKAALAVYDAADPGQVAQVVAEATREPDYWDAWITYLRRAADCDGFEVH